MTATIAHRIGSMLATTLLLSVCAASAAPDTDGLDAAIAEAEARNPGLTAARAEARAAGHAADRVRGLPDPRLGFTHALRPVETRVGPQEQIVSLTQSLPWFGTLGLRGEVARAHADAAAAEADALRLDVRADTAAAWWELAYLDRALGATRAHRELAARREETARARYAAGDNPYADVLDAQIELGLLDDRAAALDDRRRPLLSALNALRDRPSTDEADAELPSASPPPLPDAAGLIEDLVRLNPRLAAWGHRADAARRGERLAAKDGLPTVTAGMTWIRHGASPMTGVADDGADAFTASLALTLPIWRAKVRSGTLEAARGLEAAEARGAALRNALTAELEDLLFRHADAVRRAALHRDVLIPRAEQAAAAVRAAYEGGDDVFDDLIADERLLLEFDLAHARAVADALIAEARVERLIARPLADR